MTPSVSTVSAPSRPLRATPRPPAAVLIGTVGLLLAVLSVYLYHAYWFAVDFPFMDDTSLLRLVYEVRGSTSLSYTFQRFLAADNDHRLVIPRLIAYGDYLLNGSLNFRAYILLANVNLLAVLWLLYRRFRAARLPLYYFLPVPFLLLQFQYHEVTNWAVTGLQHTTLCLLALLISELVSHPSRSLRRTLALGLAVAATFTHGNGITTFGIGMYVLLAQRDVAGFRSWVLAAVACLTVYVWGYSFSDEAATDRSLVAVAGVFFGLLGANLSVLAEGSLVVSVVWGLVVTAAVVPAVLTVLLTGPARRPNREAVLCADFVFVFLTLLMVALFRAQDQIGLPNRFKLYAALASALGYLMLLQRPQLPFRGAIFATVLLASVGFNGLCYATYLPENLYKRSQYLADTFNWKRHRLMLSVPFAFNHNAAYYLRPAYDQGYWQLPDYLPETEAALQTARACPTPVRCRQIRDGHDELLLLDYDPAPHRHQRVPNDLVAVLIHQQTNAPYLVGAMPRRLSYKTMLAERALLSATYTARVVRGSLPPGRYRVGLLVAESAARRPHVTMLADGVQLD